MGVEMSEGIKEQTVYQEVIKGPINITLSEEACFFSDAPEQKDRFPGEVPEGIRLKITFWDGLDQSKDFTKGQIMRIEEVHGNESNTKSLDHLNIVSEKGSWLIESIKSRVYYSTKDLVKQLDQEKKIVNESLSEWEKKQTLKLKEDKKIMGEIKKIQEESKKPWFLRESNIKKMRQKSEKGEEWFPYKDENYDDNNNNNGK
jgi:hypothetical protein